MSSYRSRWGIVATTGAVAAALALTAAPASATSPAPAAHPGAPTAVKTPLAIGRGGAVSTVDFDASRAGLQILRAGGNAADAAVAAAAALGVTEPFSAGIGGGGYFVYYNARTHRVSTVDGRETAPRGLRFQDLRRSVDRMPYPFETAVESGLSVGVPGTPATWQTVARQVRHPPGRDALKPAIRIARARLRRRCQTFDSQIAPTREASRVQLDVRALPAGRPAAGGRQHVPQPRPRRHLPAARSSRHRQLLHGPARPGDRQDRTATRRWPRARPPTIPG